MRRFILEIFIFTLISMLCFSVYGQNWQDEEHVWSEEKGRFEVHNRAHGRVANAPVKAERNDVGKFEPPSEEWSRYLPWTVRYGKREATSWEIREAQRKLWAKGILTQRAMARGEQRRQLIAYRKVSGWYAARRGAGLQHGAGAYNHHMSFYNGGGYGYSY
jgi:hypothetical protein